MTGFLTRQGDYILFVAAFALFVAMAECLVLSQAKPRRRLWIWMAGFLIMQAFAILAAVAAGAFTVLGGPGYVPAAMNSISFCFLLAFGLQYPGSARPGLAWRLAPLVLLAGFTAVAAAAGRRALDTTSWLAGAPVALLAAATLLRRARSPGPGRTGLAAFAACLGLLGLLSAAAGVTNLVTPGRGPLVARGALVLVCIGLGVSLVSHGTTVLRAATGNLGKGLGWPSLAGMLALFPALLGMGWGLTDFLGSQALKIRHGEADTQLHLYRSIISAHTQEMDTIATMLAGSPSIAPFLATRDPGARRQVESALDRYSSSFPSTVCYVLDTNGTTLSSSNRRGPDSFEGQDYSRRPYVAEALAGRHGSYFAVGVTSGVRGYYASAPVRAEDGRLLGIVAIKQEIDHIASTLGSATPYYVVDPDGIVFLSGDHATTLRSLWPLPDPDPRAAERAIQFGPVSLDSVFTREPGDGAVLGAAGEDHLVARRPLSPPGWSLIVLVPLRLVTHYRLAGILATLIVSTIVLAFSGIGKITRLSAARIEESRLRYRGLVETLPAWVSIVDAAGVCRFVNGPGLQALGRAREELVGKNIDELFGADLVRLIGTARSGARATGRASFEAVMPAADGAPRTWSVTVVPLSVGGRQGEIMLIASDITDSRSAAERLVRAERLAALGSLSAGVAHQFNNINTVALSYLELVRSTEQGLSEKSRQHLAAARGAIDRSVAITSSLLALSRAPGAAEESSLLSEAVTSVVEGLRPALRGEGIELRLELGDTLPVPLERRHADFIVRELLSNARHAMRGSSNRALVVTTGHNGAQVFLSVSDTGIGIGQEDLSSIFTPFHSRKGEHAPPGSPQSEVKGVGMSLAIAHAMVKGRGGRIDVKSRPGNGSVFTVWLPGAAQAG